MHPKFFMYGVSFARACPLRERLVITLVGDGDGDGDIIRMMIRDPRRETTLPFNFKSVFLN